MRHEHAVSSLRVQIAHFLPERSQIFYESIVHSKVEGSWSKMVTKGKVAKVEMALEACGKIHCSKTSNGIPCCMQAGTAPHVMNHLDDLLVSRTPLPMGLHCQTPLMFEVGFSKKMLATATDVTLSLVASMTLESPLTRLLNKCKEQNLNVAALFSKPVTLNPLLITHDSMSQTCLYLLCCILCCFFPLQLPLQCEVQVW